MNCSIRSQALSRVSKFPMSEPFLTQASTHMPSLSDSRVQYANIYSTTSSFPSNFGHEVSGETLEGRKTAHTPGH